jgi:hypothetical protein
MADEFNPYAPPPIVAEQVSTVTGSAGIEGLWRSGNILVMHKGVKLPPRCVKTNQPTSNFLKRNLTWSPQWVYLLLLVNVILCVIVALILQKKALIHVGQSEGSLAQRRRTIMISWYIALAGVAGFIAGLAALSSEGSVQSIGPWLMGIGGLAAFFAIVYGNFGARVVYPTKIDDNFIWLKGVCPEYLAELPPWPGSR